MKTLPNGLTIFNATPHTIRFWREDWPEPVEVEPDALVNARIEDSDAGVPFRFVNRIRREQTRFVTPTFVGTEEGRSVVRHAYDSGADLVVGSIIASQAYPGDVVAMTPAPGYERVAPAEKRMNPDKFTVY